MWLTLRRDDEQAFFEGEVVRVAHDLLRGDDGLVIACWQLRHAQRRRDGWAYFAQAVPIGVWPARFAWLPECYLVPTGIWRPVVDFKVQDGYFARAGRGNQILARRESFVVRAPLPAEAHLVRRLDELRLPFRGALPPNWVRPPPAARELSRRDLGRGADSAKARVRQRQLARRVGAIGLPGRTR